MLFLRKFALAKSNHNGSTHTPHEPRTGCCISTEGRSWGYPRCGLGAIGAVLEPFCGHLSPNVDEIFQKRLLIEGSKGLAWMHLVNEELERAEPALDHHGRLASHVRALLDPALGILRLRPTT